MLVLPSALSALAQYPQFICYYVGEDANNPEKLIKRPLDYRNGRVSNAHDRNIWTDFDTASRVGQRNGWGVGFVLTRDDPFFFIDIDSCYDEQAQQWAPTAQRLLSACAGAAVEVSSSGRGLHIIGKGQAPAHRCKNEIDGIKIEMYTEARFIALTGTNMIGNAETDLTDRLPGIVDQFFPLTHSAENGITEWTTSPRADWCGPTDDNELITLAIKSRSARSIFGTGATFADLWYDDAAALGKAFPANNPSDPYDASSADAALAQHLAFWTGCDCERIKTLMMQSSLVRPKWQRESYINTTIQKACARQTEVFKGGKSPSTSTISHSPEPLPELPQVLPFDYSYLPDALRVYVEDISQRMQCPPDFAAVAAFVMAATLCGRKVGIRPMKNNDWTVIPNLWAAVVGNSGVMKSPTLSETLTPIKKLAAEEFQLFQEKIHAYSAEIEVNKLQQGVNRAEAKKALKGKQLDTAKTLLKADEINSKPILRRYITNNSSYEALGEILLENPNGLMVEADEVIGLLKQLDASGQEVARSFYLTAADGDKSYTFDRIMRGKGLHIEAVCLSLIGGIQPGVLADYVRQAVNGGAGADGLLQRFSLMVYPDISPIWKEIDRYPNKEARQIVGTLVKKLDRLDPLSVGAEIDPYGGVPFLRFNSAAQAIFSQWREALEHRLRSNDEHPAMTSHLSKYRKLVPALALLNHLCDTGCGPVNETALQRAINFSNYLESHARRVYSFAVRPDIDAAKTLLKRLASSKLTSSFTARDLYKKCWAGLETPDKAKAAIGTLLEYGHLREEKLVTEGRPTERYHWIRVEAS